MINFNSLPAPLPQDIESYMISGEWDTAREMIEERLKLDLPRMLRDRLLAADFFMGRLSSFYPLTEAALLDEIRKLIPDYSEDDLARLRGLGWLDSKLIRGQRMYHEDLAASLLKANPEFAQRAGKPFSPHRPLLDEIVTHLKSNGQLRMKMELSSTLRIKDDHFKPGTTYRVHLPMPSPAPQQRQVQLTDIHPNPRHIARESAPQRTAYFEETLHENAPFTVSSSYVQTLYYCDPVNDPSPQVLYPDAKAPVRDDLEPQAPHILFTPYLTSLCKELIGDEIVPVRQAKRFYDFITGKVLYSYVRPYQLIENGAEYPAVNLRGDCGLQALLFIALCRMAGIPARWQSGLYAAPGEEGSHDWAWFYTEAWGWLPADPSFGGAGRRGGNEERREFYFGNLDPYRAVFNHQYMGDLQPGRAFPRNDPYDNQSGEVETADGPLPYGQYRTRHEVRVTWLPIE